MAERIWNDRCEDCFDKNDLKVCGGDLVPDGGSAELCDACIAQRRSLQVGGSSPVPIGLLMDGTWVDIAPITVIFRDGERISVAVKFLTNSPMGIVRLQLPNQKRWLAAGTFGTSPGRAISEARHFLRNSYFPGQPIEFE